MAIIRLELVFESRVGANEWPAINNSSSGGAIERPRTRVRGRVLERHALQRTRAITRNTHPMLEHATITNFRDAFVLRDAHQGGTDPLFSPIILRTRLVRLGIYIFYHV